MESPLGKIVNGSVDISGGQWQRVAIARALFSIGSVRILDEPTSALDPVSESELYEKFKKISISKTTLFISHRLASTKLADLIYVVEDGKITESGTFQELLKKEGAYAHMFNSQRKWYSNE